MVTGSYNGPAYEKLQFYKNICKMRGLIHEVTKRFPKDCMRLVSQMRDAARSAKQNIREGYRKDTIGEFVHSIKISAGSLSELEGDIDDCCEDGLIKQLEYNEFKQLFKITNYQINRYIDSIYRLNNEGKWKTRFKKVTISNR